MSKIGRNHRVLIARTGTRLGGTVQVKEGDHTFHLMNAEALRKKEFESTGFLESKALNLKTGKRTAFLARLDPIQPFDRKLLEIIRAHSRDLNTGLDCVIIVCPGCKDCTKRPMYAMGRNIHAIAKKKGLCSGLKAKVETTLAQPRC